MNPTWTSPAVTKSPALPEAHPIFAARRRALREGDEVLIDVLRKHDPHLENHASSVGQMARAVAAELGCSEREIEMIARAALLHDIGKVAIPLTILRKTGPLNADEWMAMREHTLVGQSILNAVPKFREVGVLVRYSHERWDGAGYPDGVSGEEIPLGSRIIFVCDAFDAMTENRPYQQAKTREEALEELRLGAGSQFDPDVVAAFLGLLLPIRVTSTRVRGSSPI